MRGNVGIEPGAFHSTVKGRLDSGARRRVADLLRPAVGVAVRPPEDFALAVLQVGQRRHHAGVQRYATTSAGLDLRSAFTVRLMHKHDMRAGKVDVAPIDPQRL